MNIVVLILAILLVVDASFLLIKPALCKTYIEMMASGRKVYLMAFLYAVIGIILLFSANEKCRLEYVVIAYGIAAVAMASFIIALPEKASAAAGWIGRRNSFTIRLMAVVYLAIASLLVYSA